MAPTADDAAGEQASGVILEEHYVVVVLGAFSMLGSAFIILSWLCRKPLRTASTLLIFCLAVSDFMCASPGLFALWLLGVVVSVAVWLCPCPSRCLPFAAFSYCQGADSLRTCMAKDPISSGSCPSGWQPEECNSCDV